MCTAVLAACASQVFAGQEKKRETTWSGTIVYSNCNADEAFNESPECFKKASGARFALYDSESSRFCG